LTTGDEFGCEVLYLSMGINSVMLKKCVSFGGSEDVHDLKLETGWSRPQKLAKTIPPKPMENNSTKRL